MSTQTNLDNRKSDASEYDRAKLDEFLSALTELSAQYGIGITGSPTLFVMEDDDFRNTYRSDESSKLTLG